MDFSWSREQDEYYSQVLTGTRSAFSTIPDQFWARTQWQQCGAMQLPGLSVPQCYGGRGYDALTTARVIEAFGRGSEDLGLVFSVAAHLFACVMPIVEHADESVKCAFLPGLCDGTLIGANAITEEQAGSDVFALTTRATLDEEVYLLNGQKSYVSNGPVADLFVVYAMTNSTHGYFGITAFVVERNTPGLVIGEPFRKSGLVSTPACQISFESCRVPVANRLGREGQGAVIFTQSMQWERACLFAAYIGQMERQLERSLAYARERRQFGKPLGKHQAVAHRLAAMKIRLESSRLLLYRACWSFAQGRHADLDIALAKLAVSEAAIMSGLDAVHIHGSLGIDSDYGIERMLSDALPSTIFSGTSEMQFDSIARELGL